MGRVDVEVRKGSTVVMCGLWGDFGSPRDEFRGIF
jgi:hypothetical protein